MQLRDATSLTSEEYVKQKGWRQARLDRCPLHRGGGCGFSLHGSYPRVEPPEMRVARYYCPTGKTTFSLLPDCLASRLSGSLDEVEEVVAAVEAKVASGSSIEAAAGEIRPDIELPGAVRWVRRRLQPVRIALLTLITLMPGQLGAVAQLSAFRTLLETERALWKLREIGSAHLAFLSPALGFGPRPRKRLRAQRPTQHETGPDPPPSKR